MSINTIVMRREKFEEDTFEYYSSNVFMQFIDGVYLCFTW